jgi:hypothetical protein
MDMRKYSGPRFIKVDDVRDAPIEGQIAGIKEGKFEKPDLFLETGAVLSLNATNNRVLMNAYGTESDRWIGKAIRLFLGEIEYQGADHEAVLIEPISPPVKKKEKKETEDTKATDPKKPPSSSDEMSDEIPF